jgi:hypothetical protein
VPGKIGQCGVLIGPERHHVVMAIAATQHPRPSSRPRLDERRHLRESGRRVGVLGEQRVAGAVERVPLVVGQVGDVYALPQVHGSPGQAFDVQALKLCGNHRFIPSHQHGGSLSLTH